MQRMPVYFYLSPDDSRATQQQVMAFTHDDVYKPLPGYKVMVSHFHFHFNEQLTDAGTTRLQPTWLPVFRGLGINIAILADFHSRLASERHRQAPLDEQKVYFDGCARFSDRDFLLIPGEEPDANFGGHYMFVFPRPRLLHARQEPAKGPQASLSWRTWPPYGKVYHTTNGRNELDAAEAGEGAGVADAPAHQRLRRLSRRRPDKDFFHSDRFLGGSYPSLPVDLSEKRLCEKRCLGLLDDMNNWAGAKYMIAEGDTYMKYPGRRNLSAVDRQLRQARPRSEVRRLDPCARRPARRQLLCHQRRSASPQFQHRRRRRAAHYNAEAEWTFPPEFAELVWGDGKKVDREVIRMSDMAPFGSHKFHIPFDAAGKKWVRFAVWDSAGNGAFTQPVHLK